MSKNTKAEAPTEGQGSSWTNGRQLGAKAVTVGLVAAILCGPAALVVASTARDTAPAAIAENRTSGLSAEQQTAGSYALGYVAAWLTATRDEPGELGTYVELPSVGVLSDTPWEYKDAAVVSVMPAIDGSSLMSVVVAANIKQLASNESGDAIAAAWPRRYFQVAVQVGEGSARVVGLPAPIAAPVQGESAALIYSADVPSNDPASEAVMAFMGAYLAESGEIGRYTTPGVEIAAISPAPYVLVDVATVLADVQPSAAPADGEQLRVLAAVSLSNEVDQKLTASYALTLTARAGRWEVSSIDLAPQEALSPEKAASITPSPSSDEETKGN